MYRLLLFLLAYLLACQPILGQRANDPRPPLGFSMSGGTSKGAYQSGVLAVLFNQLHPRSNAPPAYRQPEDLPVGFAGASAGNINAILGTIEWCRAQPTSLQASLFYRVWNDVGLEELIGSELEAYRTNVVIEDRLGLPRDDGLFTRRYFRDTLIPRVDSLIQHTTFREGCSAPIALMVNRFHPVSLAVSPTPPRRTEVAGLDLRHAFQRAPAVAGGGAPVAVHTPIPTTRFAALMGADVAGGRLTFRTFPFVKSGTRTVLPPVELGGWITPFANPRDPGERMELSFAQVMEVVLASSAFPMAFAPVRLDYWVPSYQQERPSCDDLMCREAAYFWDGGTFDNHPLLAAERMARVAASSRGRGDPRVVSVDVNVRRGSHSTPEDAPRADAEVPLGLEQLAGIAGAFISAARSYELQALARFEPTLIQRTDASTRMWPIYGEKFSTFGGFLSRAFRDIDFFLGIYDGVFMLAERSGCDSEAPPGNCILGELYAAAIRLGLTGCGRVVFDVAMGADFPSRALPADSIRARAHACTSLGTLGEEASGAVLSAALLQLRFGITSDCDSVSGGLGALCRADLLALRDLMLAEGLGADDLHGDEFLMLLARDSKTLVDRLAVVMLDRAWRAADRSTSEGFVEGAVEVTQALYEGTSGRATSGLEIAPGILPRFDSRPGIWAARLLPSGLRLTTDQHEGQHDENGIDLLYRARIGLGRRLAVEARPRFVLGSSSSDFGLGTGLTLVGTAVAEVSAGTEWQPGEPQDFAAFLEMRLFMDQVSVEVRHPLGIGWDRKALSFSVGFGDLAGLAYWTARIFAFDS